MPTPLTARCSRAPPVAAAATAHPALPAPRLYRGHHAAARMEGLLNSEVQEGKLFALHRVNTDLQGPFFSVFDISPSSPSTWTRELPVMLEASRSRGAANAATWDFFAAGEGSHKVSLGGDFSIQLLPWMGCKLLVCLDCCLELKRFFLEHCYYEVIDSLRLTWMMPTSVRKNALKRWSFFS